MPEDKMLEEFNTFFDTYVGQGGSRLSCYECDDGQDIGQLRAFWLRTIHSTRLSVLQEVEEAFTSTHRVRELDQQIASYEEENIEFLEKLEELQK